MGVLKYGVVGSSQKPLIPFCTGTFTASEVSSALSGRFVVYNDTDNYWELVDSGDAKIGGYIEDTLTMGTAAAGRSKLPIFSVQGQTFELPYATATSITTQLTAAVLADLIGKTCDLYSTANIQYADAGATTDNIFRIVGGDPAKSYGTLWVQVVDSALGYASS